MLESQKVICRCDGTGRHTGLKILRLQHTGSIPVNGTRHFLKFIEVGNMFQCKICGKEFLSREQLGGHVSGHSRVGKGRKKIEKFCKNCGEKLKKSSSTFCSVECFREYEKEHNLYKGMDITVAELDRYRQSHKVCEICGREESMLINGQKCNLAVDHDHTTNKFRGLLCYSCNTKLSWYENWKDNIEKYLTKNIDII